MTAQVTHILERIRPHRRRGAFTLIELLVVISIVVLLLALAVPLIGSLRGGRSVDAGENIASAMLQRARARAIWLQERRGVFFFDDQVTGKTAMLMVKIFDGNPNLLEIDDDNQEPEYLPLGIAAAFVLPPVPTSVDPTSNPNTTDYHPYGLVVFDGLGRIENLPAYKLTAAPAPGVTNLVAQFGDNLDGGNSKVNPPIPPSKAVISGLGTIAGKPEASEVAFVLYDRRGLADQGAQATDVKFSAAQKDWLDKNALAIVVNRYNGTLIRGE
jgi:prepilin-type N-terminal cleavage/methylation domain-containing protein